MMTADCACNPCGQLTNCWKTAASNRAETANHNKPDFDNRVFILPIFGSFLLISIFLFSSTFLATRCSEDLPP